MSGFGGIVIGGGAAGLSAAVEAADAGARVLVLEAAAAPGGAAAVRGTCIGGRPVLYGLAAGGEAGARRAVELLRDELSTSRALMGCAGVAELTRDHIHDGRAR